MHEPVSGFVNVMQPPWFTKGKYRSDSNQHWREGCPHEELRAGTFEWLQLLTHPEIWVYDGDTMGETMRAMLEQKRAEISSQLAESGAEVANEVGLTASQLRQLIGLETDYHIGILDTFVPAGPGIRPDPAATQANPGAMHFPWRKARIIRGRG